MWCATGRSSFSSTTSHATGVLEFNSMRRVSSFAMRSKAPPSRRRASRYAAPTSCWLPRSTQRWAASGSSARARRRHRQQPLLPVRNRQPLPRLTLPGLVREDSGVRRSSTGAGIHELRSDPPPGCSRLHDSASIHGRAAASRAEDPTARRPPSEHRLRSRCVCRKAASRSFISLVQDLPEATGDMLGGFRQDPERLRIQERVV